MVLKKKKKKADLETRVSKLLGGGSRFWPCLCPPYCGQTGESVGHCMS